MLPLNGGFEEIYPELEDEIKRWIFHNDLKTYI
jgi:hypothetical protein